MQIQGSSKDTQGFISAQSNTVTYKNLNNKYPITELAQQGIEDGNQTERKRAKKDPTTQIPQQIHFAADDVIISSKNSSWITYFGVNAYNHYRDHRYADVFNSNLEKNLEQTREDGISPYRKIYLSDSDLCRKMEKNALKANLESFLKRQKSSLLLYNCTIKGPIAEQQNLYRQNIDYSHYEKQITNVFFGGSIEQGTRPYQEDCAFFRIDCFDSLEKAVKMKLFTAVVLDGHGGKLVAEVAKEVFQKKFMENVTKIGNSCNPESAAANELDEARRARIGRFATSTIHKALELTIAQIQCRIFQDETLNRQGAAAVFFVADVDRQLAITATIGDCEAKCYQKTADKTNVIALSCIRDWGHATEFCRVAELFKNSEQEQFYTDMTTAQSTKSPNFVNGWNLSLKNAKAFYIKGINLHSYHNLSRSLGDKNFKGAVISKPKITVFQYNENDIFILGSDGLWDGACGSVCREIVDSVLQRNKIDADTMQELSENLSQKVLERPSSDNTTVLAFSFNKEKN